jgi:hypothetical protein
LKPQPAVVEQPRDLGGIQTGGPHLNDRDESWLFRPSAGLGRLDGVSEGRVEGHARGLRDRCSHHILENGGRFRGTLWIAAGVSGQGTLSS